MVEIQCELSKPLHDYIEAQIEAGRYGNTSEYFRDLVRSDQQQQQVMEHLSTSDRLADCIEEGLGSDRGRPWSTEVLEEFKQQVKDRQQ
jgi:antitoxin ParD1/3/4